MIYCSAVDVDIAVCGATEKDQMNDIIDILYCLRHSQNAADALPSTEYAAIRYLLDRCSLDVLSNIAHDQVSF